MPFSATINLGTVGVAITSVKLYGCTGSTCNSTTCTALTGYENVSVSTFPSSGLTINGIPNGVTYIQAEALGACSEDEVKQCIPISGIPGATPIPTNTPTPTPTTTSGPGPTNTQTPTATNTPTPTPSATIGVEPTNTPTPTPSSTETLGTCYILTIDQSQYDTALENEVSVSYTPVASGTLTTMLLENLEVMDPGEPGGDYIFYLCSLSAPTFSQGGVGQTYGFEFVNQNTTCIINGDCNVPQPTPGPTATPTLAPEATFSTSYGTNTSSSFGTTGSTYSTTITVINGTATIRLSVSVQTGDQGDATLTIPGVGSFSPSPAQGSGNTSFTEFTLGVGTYTDCVWVVQAIYGGSFTVATSTITQV